MKLNENMNRKNSNSPPLDITPIVSERSMSHPVVSFNLKGLHVSDDKELSNLDDYKISDIVDEPKSIQNIVKKKFGSLSMNDSFGNKMSIRRDRNRNFSLGKPCKGLGLGFPTKGPAVNLQKAMDKEKDYQNIENKINATKLEMVEKAKDNNNDNFSLINNRHDHKDYMLMEKNLVNDFKQINSSIDELLKEQRDLQKEHRLWIREKRGIVIEERKKTCKLANDLFGGNQQQNRNTQQKPFIFPLLSVNMMKQPVVVAGVNPS